MDSLTTAAKMNKVMKMGKRINIGTLQKPDGKFTETPGETLELLLDTHFPNKDTTNISNITGIIDTSDAADANADEAVADEANDTNIDNSLDNEIQNNDSHNSTLNEILVEGGLLPNTDYINHLVDGVSDNNEDNSANIVISDSDVSVIDDAVEVIASLNDSNIDSLDSSSYDDNISGARRHNDNFLDLGNIDNFEIIESINIQSITTAFKSFQPFKSPGADGVSPCLIPVSYTHLTLPTKA